MIGRKLAIASLFAALALVATAAGSARAEDHRSGTWQGLAGWLDNHNNNNRGDNQNRTWDRDRYSGRERDNWSRSNEDHQWRGRQDRQEHDRGRHQGWWHDGQREDGNRSWR